MNAYLHEWNTITIIVRLLFSIGCGGAIGLTRSVKRRGAGFKTHALVCLGASLIMMTGQYIYVTFGDIGDISRLAAQVVSGVGFLGVGTIMVTGRNEVKGLTTAAGLWACAGIGISLGIGFYLGAFITTGLVLLVYKYMGRIDEFAYEHSQVVNVFIEFEGRDMVARFIKELKDNKMKIISFELNKSKKKNDEIVNATIVIEATTRMSHNMILHTIERFRGVKSLEEI